MLRSLQRNRMLHSLQRMLSRFGNAVNWKSDLWGNLSRLCFQQLAKLWKSSSSPMFTSRYLQWLKIEKSDRRLFLDGPSRAICLSASKLTVRTPAYISNNTDFCDWFLKERRATLSPFCSSGLEIYYCERSTFVLAAQCRVSQVQFERFAKVPKSIIQISKPVLLGTERAISRAQ